MSQNVSRAPQLGLPTSDAGIKKNVGMRRQVGTIWRYLFATCIVLGLLFLGLLIWRVANDSVGLVAIVQKVDPATLAPKPLEELSKDELVVLLQSKISKNVYNRLDREVPFAQRTPGEVLDLIYERVVQLQVLDSWPLSESLFQRAAIEQEIAEISPKPVLKWRSWLDGSFLTQPMNSKPEFAGVRTAILGSLWVIALTMLIAFPIGICAAIYLEEYATDNWFNQIIRTNIYNLAGVPSIIYGMLGLAIFVRSLEYYTSGAFLGFTDTNGRTIVSAALTMALLVLPLIIINGQEAIRAVPGSIRQASYGVGATKWQTVWNHVLPQAVPGILTGTILAMSRAIGETAPLIVVGASTFIVFDPNGPFSKFTVLPIQIYDWTSRPEQQFKNTAAAAILVLLVLLLTLNALAIWLRNRYRRSI
jgi:phosphate transport system permease protein